MRRFANGAQLPTTVNLRPTPEAKNCKSEIEIWMSGGKLRRWSKVGPGRGWLGLVEAGSFYPLVHLGFAHDHN